MVYALQAHLVFSNETKRTFVVNALETRLTGRPRWDIDAVYVVADKATGQPALDVTLRFTTEANRDDVVADLITRATGRVEPGSTITIHPCDHDEATSTPCVPTIAQEW